MSGEATRQQHEPQKPREDEGPNRSADKNSQEGNRNTEKDNNNLSPDRQRQQEHGGTPRFEGDRRQDESSDAIKKQGEHAGKENKQHQTGKNSTDKDDKRAVEGETRRPQTDKQPAQ